MLKIAVTSFILTILTIVADIISYPLQFILFSLQAWSKAMLESHVMWHEDDVTSRPRGNDAHFRCPVCPCAVGRFSDFRFHLQFHKQDTKVSERLSIANG